MTRPFYAPFGFEGKYPRSTLIYIAEVNPSEQPTAYYESTIDGGEFTSVVAERGQQIDDKKARKATLEVRQAEKQLGQELTDVTDAL